YVDWHVLDGPPESVTIIEIRDSTGSAIFTYEGYALAGFSSPGLWQAGDLIADSIHVPVPEAGAYTVFAGLQQALAEAPMAATGSDGTEYPDELLPIGEFNVSETGTISAGSGP
ncbi:MAG: hypothetical protein M3439_09185, partial [Chloroflexota bacterium]|nr:hypothetical protein [Chloroflexota bacterium]